MKNTRYNKELMFKIVKHSGGMLVSQLYDSLPKNERPHRKYFIEFLRKISGLYLLPYSTRENCLFVTTTHGIVMSRKRLLIMSEAIRQQEVFKYDWFVNVKQLPKVYSDLKAWTKPYRKSEDGQIISEGTNFDEAIDWMKYYLMHQSQTLFNQQKRNNEKPDWTITMKQAPMKPNITLLSLYRRHIYIYAHLTDNHRLNLIEFKVLDSDDNLTNRRLANITLAINDFMYYHKIQCKYSITVYVWNRRKLELYSSRLKMRPEVVERAAELKDKTLKTELFTKRFEGYQYVNLNLDQYFSQTGLSYWDNSNNRELLKDNDPEVLEMNLKRGNIK